MQTKKTKVIALMLTVAMVCGMLCALPMTVSAQSVSNSDFVAFARANCIGIPYVSGGRSTKGFDCCGLVWYVCNHFGIDVGSGNQNSQRNYGTAVSYSLNSYDAYLSNLKEGDLIFFDYQGDGVSDHVGIYSGNGMIIQAHKPGTNSREDKLSGIWRDNKAEWKFTCNVRRVLNSVTVKTYTIFYDANGGTGAPPPQTKQHDVPLTISDIAPSRSMYTFIGWAPLPNASEPTGWPGGITNVNQDITFYALWKPNTVKTYTISYDANGGTGAPPPQTKQHDVPLTLSNIAPSRVMYTFLGWAPLPNASEPTGVPGGITNVNQDITFYALWKPNTYTITYDANGGTGAPPVQSFVYGSGAKLSTGIPVKVGYTFINWKDAWDGNFYNPGDPIPSGWGANTLIAQWKANPDSTAPTNQTVTTEKQSYTLGETVRITPTAEKATMFTMRVEFNGKIVHSVYDGFTGTALFTPTVAGIYDVHISAVNDFGFSNAQCSFTVTDPKSDLPEPAYFRDVQSGEYYYEPVVWAVKNDITTGTSEDTFSPNAECTRAQAVTFLWRAAGKPEPAGQNNPFSDVKPSDYYYKAVLWAVENNITSGTSKTTFSPNENCIRAQIVTFLWRSMSQPEPANKNHPFRDVSGNAYYNSAVCWAVENEITAGTTATTFAPDQTCVRGQIVTFLYRYYR